MKLDEIVSNIAELVADPVSVTYRDDPDGPLHIVWVNASFCDVFGVTKDDALKMSSRDLFHWDYSEDFQARLAEMAAMGKADLSQDTLCLRKDQSSFWASVSLTNVGGGDDAEKHGIMVIRDIDELKNREQSAELALIEREHLLNRVEATQSRLVSAIDMIPDPFAIFDRKERLVIWNPAFAEKSTGDQNLKKGMKKEEILGIAIENGFIADAVGQEQKWLADHLKSFRSGARSSTHIKICGSDFESVHSTTPNGDRVVFRIDVTEHLRHRQELESYAKQLEQANNEIGHQALHDELTGLGNRRYLTMKLDELIEERRVKGGELAALHIDLDRFKQINDTMGHAAGDHVLVVVAEILRKHLRRDDTVARIGGDEFVVLLKTGADSHDAEVLSERLITEVAKPILFEDKTCRVGASIGIARTPVIDPGELLTSSDVALYKAKQGGRSMHAVFDHVDLENLRIAKQTSDDILRAVEAEEFIPFYQVQIDPFSNRVVALEVLARWQHPQKGLVMPDVFIGYAEETQVLGQIDGLIFRRALRECVQAFGTLVHPPALAFNVSLQRLLDPRLDDDIDSLRYPYPVSFELVETDFFDRDHDYINRIGALRDLGIGIEVDDFGSGRASVVGLRELNADRLKLDHRLVQPITQSLSARKLVQSMVDIGRSLDIPVTAEGVETEQHAAILQSLGCDRMQGYLYAPALPFDDVFQLIRSYEAASLRTGTG